MWFKSTKLENQIVSDVELIKEIRKYWENITIEKDFDRVIQQTYRTENDFRGIILYSVYKFFWNKEEKIPTADFLSQNIGEEIKDLVLEVVRVNSFDSQFGISYINVFKTLQNNIVVSMNSYKVGEVGEKFNLTKCKVHEKTAWKNINQTYIKTTRQKNFVQV